MSSSDNAIAIADSNSQEVTGRISDIVKRVKEDNDPQTAFFINLIYKDPSKQTEFENAQNEIALTISSWAPKIEQTIQSSKLYQGSAKNRCTLQGGWDRASYRAKLIDYLVKNTPWLTMSSLDQKDPAVEELTGDYYHDKLIYRDSARNFLSLGFPESQGGGLRITEKYIMETMALSHEKLVKLVRFAVVSPFLNKNGPLIRSGIRVATLSFERKKNDKGKLVLEVAMTKYEATVNKKAFDNEPFEQKYIEVGKELARDYIVDVVV